MSALEHLASHLESSSRAPFLFIGAGISRRYLKADGWIQLLKRMAELTGRPYAYYASKANNDSPSIATEIAANFHELWWTDSRFSDSRAEFGEGLTTAEGPLKVEVARYTQQILEELPTTDSLEFRELSLLKAAVIDGIVTTNYDELLESLFPEYRTYVGQDELLFAEAQGIGEIYKIHGSCSNPESIVLTKSDYERYNTRNPYLAAKLLTIFIEHPIIFLGYSLNDPNVTDILVSVAKVLTTENLSKLQGRLIFVQWSPSAASPILTSTQIAASGFTIPVMQLAVKDFIDVYETLAQQKRKFSAQMLRQLKEHVYELVSCTNPKSKLAVLDIEESTDVRDLEVVFGVGLMGQLGRQGYIGLKRADLLTDVLQPTSRYDARRIVDEALPAILKQPGQTPVFRYLRQAGRLRDDGTYAPSADLDARLAARASEGNQRFRPPMQSKSRSERLAGSAKYDVRALVAGNTCADTLLAILSIPEDKLDLEALREYLLSTHEALNTTNSTGWSKAVCLYDYYRYARITELN